MLFNKTPPPLPPVDNDQFTNWLNDPVTAHLLRDLECMYIDSVLDAISLKSTDTILTTAIRRDMCREVVDMIFDWAPEGVDKGEMS